MKDNTVKDQYGNSIDVYSNRIFEKCDEYICGLDEKEENQESMIRKTPIFKGMLKNIYINIFKITAKDIKYNNKNSCIDYSDIDLLNELWDVYTGLCYKYCQCPTLLNFSLMTGIAHETLTDWTTGKSQVLDSKLGSLRCQSAKKWRKECESAAYDVAMSGNPGGMFILKANYGYTETPQTLIVSQGTPTKSLEQIAEEYKRQSKIGQNDAEIVPPEADF